MSAVITPRVPSEPRISWRRSGPAADLGARPSFSVPAGVATRSPARGHRSGHSRPRPGRSSARRQSRRAWRTRRTAGSGPACSPRRRAAPRPRVRAGRARAGPAATPGLRHQRVQPPQVERDQPAKPPLGAQSADDRGPAAERDDGHAQLASRPAGPPAPPRGSRARRPGPARRRPAGAQGSRSRVDRPSAWRGRVSWSARAWSRPPRRVALGRRSGQPDRFELQLGDRRRRGLSWVTPRPSRSSCAVPWTAPRLIGIAPPRPDSSAAGARGASPLWHPPTLSRSHRGQVNRRYAIPPCPGLLAAAASRSGRRSRPGPRWRPLHLQRAGGGFEHCVDGRDHRVHE